MTVYVCFKATDNYQYIVEIIKAWGLPYGDNPNGVGVCNTVFLNYRFSENKRRGCYAVSET